MPGWLAVPNHHIGPGRRGYALLLFFRNTGARASEATQGTVAELALQTSPASGCWALETKSVSHLLPRAFLTGQYGRRGQSSCAHPTR
jgi:hypothetical protein